MTVLTVVKTADETRTANTALADSELSLTLAPNTSYRIRGQVVYCATATCDIKIGLSSGSDITGAACIMFSHEPIAELDLSTNADSRSAIVVLSNIQTGLAKPFVGIGDSTTYTTYTTTVPISGVVTTGADGATLSVVWAQNTLSAPNPARVLAGSCLIAEPVPATTKRQIVIKTADEGRADPAADYAPDAELVGITLEANTRYWIELSAACYSKASFATNVYGRLKTDATIADTNIRLLRHTTAPLSSVSTQPSPYIAQGVPSDGCPAYWFVFNNIGNNTAYRGMMHGCGLLETGETGGELWFEWRKINNGGEYGEDVTVFKDAYLIAEKLNSCTFTPVLQPA